MINALREAIEFAEQDAQALTPAGKAMVHRWRDALAAAESTSPVAWRYRYNGQWYFSQGKSFALNGFDVQPMYIAPEDWPHAYIDRLNQLCAKYGCEPGSDRLAWLDEQLSKMSAKSEADDRPGGFDGPTAAD